MGARERLPRGTSATSTWARENAATCAWAAEGGHLEVLKWARENGCPWDEETRELAAEELGYVES